MVKMIAPKLEIIRFNADDVIVTSSTAMVESLKPETSYFALGSEIIQFDPNEDISSSRFYTFKYNPTLNQIQYTSRTAYRENEIKNSQDFYYLYAWYNNGWVTENQYKDYYFNLGSWTQ